MNDFEVVYCSFCSMQFSTARAGGIFVGYISLFLGLLIAISCYFERKHRKDTFYASIFSEFFSFVQNR